MLKGNFMQLRRLRLGDILDDYCPRERRVTNHAVVAIVGDDVKQTRCTTCDVDHEYRHGKAPAPRRPKAAGALASEPPDDSRPVLARAAAAPHEAPEEDMPDVAATPLPIAPLVEAPPLSAAPADDNTAAEGQEPAAADERDVRDDDGPVHRRLIRATFPRPEGHVPERREPEFTVRQQGGRGRGPQGQGGGFGGGRGFGGRQAGSGFGYDQRNSGRGPGGRGSNRQGGGGGNRGPRQGGAGRKGR
jgi:hypothetical protein